MQNQISKNWQKVRLGDNALLNPTVILGKGHFPYIPMEDLDWNRKYVSEKVIKDFKGGAKFEEGDVLFARITPCLENGKIGKVKQLTSGKGFGSTEYFVIRGKERVTDTDFLYYLCRTNNLRQTARNSMVGASGRQRANIESLQNYELCLPDYSEQKRIASVLSAFDDKIEINNKIAKTLEQMAQALFKEWFTNDKDEDLRVKDLFDIAEVTYGYPFKSDLFNDVKNGTPVIRIRNLDGSLTSTYTTEIVEEKYKVKNGDILIGMDGEFYIRKWSGGEAYLNQRVVRLRPKEVISWFHLFLSVVKPIRNLQSSISGTTVAHLSDKDLKSIKVVMPSSEIYGKLSTGLDNLYWLSIKLSGENKKLAALRDLLLPKLMKGEIRI